MQDRVEILTKGSEILAPSLRAHGFSFQIDRSGNSSGGPFASGYWSRDNRRLELHFRWHLGLVAYHLGPDRISHGYLVWAVSGKRNAGTYPGSSGDLFERFHLLNDEIVRFGQSFLCGSDDEFLQVIQKAKELSDWWGSLSPLKRLEVE